MCRGNNRSAWHAEGSYDAIAEKAFSQLNVDRFLLEFDTERAGGFEPLRFVPKDKMVVLGLISSKDPQLESIDDLRRKIDEAARYVPFENLAISPQCGFASSDLGNLLTWDEQRRKLELVVETAAKVWGWPASSWTAIRQVHRLRAKILLRSRACHGSSTTVLPAVCPRPATHRPSL
jgi:5-methyltetrahydropteroyltriglutamate--homocysteine methyltransferase